MTLSYFALFFALLTQAGKSSTVDSDPFLHRDVANWTGIARSPLRLRRDFLAPSDKNAPRFEGMHVFGTILNKKKDVLCEGVLLTDRIVLTVSECFRPVSKEDSKTLAFTFLGISFPIEEYSFPKDFLFAIARLKERIPPRVAPLAYAFPMWTGAWQTKEVKWVILPEQISSYPYRLSSYYTSANDLRPTISNALKSCQFADKAEKIALRCNGKFDIRNGASFFRQITNNPLTQAVAVPALVLKDASKSCSTSESHKVFLKLRKPKSDKSKGVYYCGPRFTYGATQNIIKEAKKLGVSVSDLDVIPNGRLFGSMNLNGGSRLKRDLGTSVLETWVDIFGRTDIMAVQEIYRFPQLDEELKKHGYDRASYRRRMTKKIRRPDGYVLVIPRSYVSATDFYYKSNDIDAEECFELSNDYLAAYGIYCRFRYKPKMGKEQQCFHFFNVHLAFSKNDKRADQLKNLRKELLENEMIYTSECKNVLIGGDFNIKNPKEMRDAIRTLSDMRFHDTGDTTPKDSSKSPESHYDHLLVSHSTRLLHQYYPEALPGERPNELYKKFVPVSEFRPNKPVVRSYDLSDHLPVRFRDSSTNANIGTWNLQYFNLFDVNVPDKKESKHKEAYTRVFDHFHILALQELSGSASNLYGKTLEVSSATKELGIAYDSNYVTLVGQCSDLKVTNSKGFSLREMFGCTFQTKDEHKKRVTVFSVHVENGNGTQKTGRRYQARANTFAKEETNVGKVYLAGDFNMKKPADSEPCKHRNGDTNWEYTRIPSKKILDYVWDSERILPGMEECEVLNPELMKDDDKNYIIPDRNTEPMPLFATWKEISDHLPVMVQFNTE